MMNRLYHFKKSAVLLFWICGFLFTGCHSIHVPIVKSKQQRQCQNQCLGELQYCRKICKDSCPNCCGLSKFHAMESFRRYANQADVQGFFPINLLQYYDDPLKCKKTSCDCQADYILCKQHCAGIITKKLNNTKPC
jgi:hypothetical protein